MPDAPLFSAMFSFVGVIYGLVIPLVIVQLLALLIFSSLLNREAKPHEVAQAVFCYCMMALGILLMSAGALPTIISILAGVKLAGATYFTLLIIFAAGGGLFLWHDSMVRSVPVRSREVSEAVFLFLFKIAGHLLVFLWGLSFIVTLLNGLPLENGWWIMPAVMIAYGLLFIWATQGVFPAKKSGSWNRSSLRASTPASTIQPWAPAPKAKKKAAPKKKQAAATKTKRKK